MSEKCIGRHYRIVCRGGIALESYLQKRLYEHTFPQLAVFYFLSWQSFVSSVGRVSFPRLAAFHFLSWLKHYQKKLFLHGKTIASYTRLTLLWQLFFALKIAKPQSLESITKTTENGQAACPCGVSSFLTWGKHRAPSGQLSYPKLCPKHYIERTIIHYSEKAKSRQALMTGLG